MPDTAFVCGGVLVSLSQMRELAGSHQEVPVLPEAQARHGGPATTTRDPGHSSSWPFPHPPPHFTSYSSHGSNPLSAFIRHTAFPGHPQRRRYVYVYTLKIVYL